MRHITHVVYPWHAETQQTSYNIISISIIADKLIQTKQFQQTMVYLSTDITFLINKYYVMERDRMEDEGWKIYDVRG